MSQSDFSVLVDIIFALGQLFIVRSNPVRKKLPVRDSELGKDEISHFPAWWAIFDDFLFKLTGIYEKIFNGNFLSSKSWKFTS